MQLTSRVFPIFCRALVGAWLVLGTLLGARNNASAVEVGAGVRAGTLGLGGDIDVGQQPNVQPQPDVNVIGRRRLEIAQTGELC